MQVDMPNNYHKLTKSRLIELLLYRDNLIQTQQEIIQTFVDKEDESKITGKSVTDVIYDDSFTIWQGGDTPGITVRYDIL